MAHRSSEGGGGVILQCHSMQIVLVKLTAHRFWENAELTLLRLNNSEVSPQNPLLFLTTGIGIYGPVRKWFKIRRKIIRCWRNGEKKQCLKFSFQTFFSPVKFLKHFFLFVLQNFIKFVTKKEKSLFFKYFFDSKNGGKIVTGYTFHVSYTYCADRKR